MMQRCQQPLLLLCLTAVVAINIPGFVAEAVEATTLFLTNNSMQVIPYNEKGVNVTILVIKGTLITLNERDQHALASYPTVRELHLDHNHVASVPAKFFSVVPHVRVLSLSRNNISCVHPEAFNGLDVLTKLDLSQNMLTSLPTPLFGGIHSLQVLNLQENPWNCSCPLLIGIGEVTAANISIVSTVTQRAMCTSPEQHVGKDLLEVTAMCYPSTLPSITTGPPEQPTLLNTQQSCGSSVLKTTVSSNQNQSRNNDSTPVVGNTWKFTACVAALALTTSILIVCAIKGPSWYKLFHNYRHQRLGEDEDYDGDNVASTSFSETRRYRNHQTFTFQQDNRDRDEEDGYFEDPYIKREE